MEFTETFIQENGLTEDQVTAINTVIDGYVAEEKKNWDGKANKDAEGIIDGAINATKTKFGLSGSEFERKTGEKQADYLNRITPLVVETALFKEKQSLQKKETELQEKINNGSVSDAVRRELEETKLKLDSFKEDAAKFSEWKEADYKGKYEEATKELAGLRLNVAYQGVRPNFPETVNVYEARAKWNDFIDRTNNEFNIELDKDNIAWAVDKQNEHSRKKLEELVKKDNEISELIKGREAKGLGGSHKQGETIEGVPFKIDKNASSTERSKLITDYLISEEKLDKLSSEFSKRYKEINSAILKKN